MLTEEHKILDANHVILVLLVMLIKVEEDLQLHARLVLKLLLISDDLHGHFLAVGMVPALQRLPKAAGAESLQDLKSVANVVLQHRLIVAVVVVVAVVVDVHLLQSFDLPLARYHGLPAVVVPFPRSTRLRAPPILGRPRLGWICVRHHLDDVALDFAFAVLTEIINLLAILCNLLLLVLI